MTFDFSLVAKYIPFLLEATLLTIEISALAIIASIIIGGISALMKISKYKVLQKISDGYIAFIRGVPLLVQLYLVYYVLPELGLSLSAFSASVLGLGIYAGSYVSEIFRGSISSIPFGQMEAARSLGMSYFMAMKKVIMPQALRVSLPPLGNQFIITLKNSSLCSVITANELMHSTERFASVNFAFLEFFVVTSIIYFTMTYSLSKLLGVMERKLSVGERRSAA
ncbi:MULTISPECIES: amino acid ABC transporter permease [Cytobacillus]|uniref:amino acid ABC transporter permease n=1 Tax=Cytobacillus TaxID=2675230 RepID=UPI00204221D3|nr:amino acid ABC transporter permease [Cytobacillus firmus]MCM3706369.1 amino acid ABC transporter permease [Cytobacillus firmus]URM32700.1 amino acid ABC transporter permease [Cytobacillus firmus]